MASDRDRDPAHTGATATLVRGGAPVSRPLAARIHGVGVRCTPEVLHLRHGTCVVGSAEPADLVIAEPTVSKMHAELTLVADGVEVRDLGSRNGTRYLGQRFDKMVLALGGRIEVGGATLAVDADTADLADSLQFDGDTYRGIVGVSTAMKRIFALLTRLEGSLVGVLIEGESGSGKEGIARALHEGSSVSKGPLVTVNCGAIPRDLVASELFGHRRGAFTGAVDTRRGAFEAADGGTLFLDEIGELPLDVQPVLLRALETGEVRPVGGDAKTVKVRIVAATNRDLAAQVESGTFREDLFYRLAVVRLKVPALRERPDDIEPLAHHFGAAIGLGDIPAEIVQKLRGRTWPGNARELRNAVQAYAAIGALPEPSRPRGGMLEVALRELVDVTRPYADQKDDLVDRFTRLYLQDLLAHANGNQTVAARIANLDRTYLGRLLSKYGLGK